MKMRSELPSIFELKQDIDITDSVDVIDKIACLTGHHLCYWEFDPADKTYNASSAYLPIEGINFSDFNWPRNFLSIDDREIYARAVNNLLERQVPFSMKLEFAEIKKWVLITTKYSKSKKIFQGIVKDITSELLTEVTLRNRTIELSAFDEGLDNFSIVVRTDSKGKIIYANKEFCRLSKYTYDELIGKDHRIINSGYHSKAFFKEMWEHIQQGISWRGLIRNKAKDGSFYWVDTMIIPIRDEVGKLLEILSFRFDVTLAQAYKEENARLKEQIAELLLKKDSRPQDEELVEL